jgi:predicted component of type VI protein secretion system
VDIILSVKSKADQTVRNVRHPASARMLLGRGPDSAVPLEAPGISREHLEVQAEDSALFLTDLSSNGTWLNGARMPPRRKCKVREGDFIELPGYEIQLQMAAAASTPSDTVAFSPTAPAKSARTAASPADARSSSMVRSFTALELFLFLVVLASTALLLLYLTF